MKVENNDEYINADVLIIGGGLAGCFAAIKAAEEGAKVVIFEKANILRSGEGGTGLHRIPLIHPDYGCTYEEFAKANVAAAAGICDEDISYEFAKDTLGRILDLESYGVKVRKDDGSFIQMPGDPSMCPGLNKAFIYGPGPTVWHDLKPTLAKKALSYPNVSVLNRTVAIGLLTKEGAIGSEVAGAIGLGTRTGNFVVCQSKAVVLVSGGAYRNYRNTDSLYAPTRFLEACCQQNVGEGVLMAYRAGADLSNMELTAGPAPVWKDFHHLGVGPVLMLGRQVDGKLQAPPLDSSGRCAPPLSAYALPNLGGPFYFDVSQVPGYPEEKDQMQVLLWAFENESTSAGYLQWMKERGEDLRKAPVEFEWAGGMHIRGNQAGIYANVDAESSLAGLYCAGDTLGGGNWMSSGGAFVFGARAVGMQPNMQGRLINPKLTRSR